MICIKVEKTNVEDPSAHVSAATFLLTIAATGLLKKRATDDDPLLAFLWRAPVCTQSVDADQGAGGGTVIMECQQWAISEKRYNGWPPIDDTPHPF